MKKADLTAQLEKEKEHGIVLTRQYNQISALRLICFLLIILCFCLAWFGRQLWGYAGAALLVAFFLYLMTCHHRLVQRQAYCMAKQKALQKIQDCFDRSWYDFPENGEVFLEEDLPVLEDLDVFGSRSLYQFLCAAGTSLGKKRLAEWLKNEAPEVQELRRRQEAVRELAAQVDFSLELRTLLCLLQERKSDLKEQETFLQAVEQQKVPESSAFFRIFPWVMTAATWIFVGLSLSGTVHPFVGAAFLLLQLGLTLFSYTRHMKELSPLFLLERKLTEYEALFELLENNRFDSQLLAEQREKIADGAHEGLRKLRIIGAAVRLRHNPILYMLAAALVLWDHHCTAAFLRWQKKYGAKLRGWFEALAVFEACMSLQLPVWVRETVCFPKLLDTDHPKFQAAGMRHPLMEESEAVPNDINLEQGIGIITGSNMSGKTTFLRTIGLNTVLAYAGGPVCAESMELSRMKVFTSMRVEDDVSRGISTFYAELLRIRTMVAYHEQHRPMMALIDEIFKGTNSADRIVGATAAVKRLSSAWCIALVSTHDFELCALENDPNIRAKNFHFEEHYHEDQICFDYKVKDGRCQTTNAKHLLRLVGILEEDEELEGMALE